jgi:hypothetical protein
MRGIVWWDSFVEGYASYWAGTDTKPPAIHCFQKDNTLLTSKGQGLPLVVFIPHKFKDAWDQFTKDKFQCKRFPEWKEFLKWKEFMEIARRQEKRKEKKKKPNKKRKRHIVAAEIMASPTAPVAAEGIGSVVRGKTTRTPEQKRAQEEAALGRAAKKKRKEQQEREAKQKAKEKPAHANRGRNKLTKKERLAQKRRLNLVARLRGGAKKEMDAPDCPGVADSLSDYEENDDEVIAMDEGEVEDDPPDNFTSYESEGEVEDDPPDNYGSYEEYRPSPAADAADVLGEADAILNEDSQSSTQTWTNPGLIPVPDEMTAGTPR